MIWNPFRRKPEPVPHPRPTPSPEAVRESLELARLRRRVEHAVREREQLLADNNYTARIRALYREGRS